MCLLTPQVTLGSKHWNVPGISEDGDIIWEWSVPICEIDASDFCFPFKTLHNLFGTKLSTDVTATPVPGTNDLTALCGAGVALELIPEMLTLGQ